MKTLSGKGLTVLEQPRAARAGAGGQGLSSAWEPAALVQPALCNDAALGRSHAVSPPHLLICKTGITCYLPPKADMRTK